MYGGGEGVKERLIDRSNEERNKELKCSVGVEGEDNETWKMKEWIRLVVREE